VQIDPADVDFDDENGISIKGYELQDTDGDGTPDVWVEAVTTLTHEQLAAMSDADKVAAANNSVELPEGTNIEDLKVKVETGSVVTYSQDGEHVVVYNLATGETHNQLGYKEYRDGQYLRVFWDNDWDYEGYTPELDKHKDLTDKLVREGEAILATNYYNRNIGIPKRILDGTTAEKMTFLKNTILPEWNKRVNDGTLFADGYRIPLDGGVLIDGQIPDINVKFEYNPEYSTYVSQNTGKETYDLRNHPWISQVYEPEENIIRFTIGFDHKVAKKQNKKIVGGMALGNFAFMTMDILEVVGGANGDMRGSSVLYALNVPNLGSDFFSEYINGNLRPDISIAWAFDGLDDKYYNQ
jgi:hypothetical protein